MIFILTYQPDNQYCFSKANQADGRDYETNSKIKVIHVFLFYKELGMMAVSTVPGRRSAKCKTEEIG